MSSVDNLNLLIYPNPNDGTLKIKFNLDKIEDVLLTIYDLKGSVIETTLLTGLSVGKIFYEKEITNLTPGGSYFISIKTANQKKTHKLVIKR